MKEERKNKIIAYAVIIGLLIVAYNLSFGEAGGYIRELIKEVLRELF